MNVFYLLELRIALEDQQQQDVLVLDAFFANTCHRHEVDPE